MVIKLLIIHGRNLESLKKKGKKLNIKSIGFLGNKGGKAKGLCDNFIIVKSNNTATIQETHIFIGHLVFEQVEKRLLKSNFV